MRNTASSLCLFFIVVASGCAAGLDTEGLFHCDQAIEGQFPSPGTPDAFAGGWIILDLHCPVREPTLSVQPQQGSPWELTTQVVREGLQVRALPGMPLAPNARFIIGFDDSGFDDSWLLSTSSLGSPLSYPLLGHSEELLLDQGLLFSPASLSQTLIGGIHSVRPVIQFLAEPTASTISGRLGSLLSESNQQDDSWPTIDRSFDWQAPYFSFGSLNLRWALQGWSLVLEQARISGTTHPVLEGTGAINIEALWDTREADSLLGGAAGALCDFDLQQGGQGCIPCADTSQSCLELLLLDVPTRYWPDELKSFP